jgi:hypothetical protein
MTGHIASTCCLLQRLILWNGNPKWTLLQPHPPAQHSISISAVLLHNLEPVGCAILLRTKNRHVSITQHSPGVVVGCSPNHDPVNCIGPDTKGSICWEGQRLCCCMGCCDASIQLQQGVSREQEQSAPTALDASATYCN